jgi:hypothetical protein
MKNAEKKSVVVLPKIESKELRKYIVTRRASVEFTFEVYAEDGYDAEAIVENNTSLYESSDGVSIEYDSCYYDAEGYVTKIEFDGVGSSDWESVDNDSCGDSETIYMFEDGDWDDESLVFNSEDALIEDFISSKDIDTLNVEVVKFEDAPTEEVQEEGEEKVEFFPSLNFLFWCQSVINGDVLSNQVFEMYKDSAIFPNARFRVSGTTIDIQYGDNISCTFEILPKHFANEYCLYGHIVAFLDVYVSNARGLSSAE